MKYTWSQEAQWIEKRKIEFLKVSTTCKMKAKLPRMLIFESHKHPDVYIYSNANRYEIGFSSLTLDFSDKIMDGFLRRAMADLFFDVISSDTMMCEQERKNLFSTLLREFKVPTELK